MSKKTPTQSEILEYAAIGAKHEAKYYERRALDQPSVSSARTQYRAWADEERTKANTFNRLRNELLAAKDEE